MTPPEGVTRVYYVSQAEGADETYLETADLLSVDINKDGEHDIIVAAATDRDFKENIGCIYVTVAPLPTTLMLNLDYDLKICGAIPGRNVGDDIVVLPDITGDGSPDIVFTTRPMGNDCSIVKIFDASLRGRYTDMESYATITNDLDCNTEHPTSIESVASLGDVSRLALRYYLSSDQREIGLIDARIRGGTSDITSLVINTITSPGGSYQFGTSLTSGHDVNADGYQDIWLADPLAYVDQKGEIYAFLGPFTGDMTIEDADYTFRGEYSSTICDFIPPFPGCYTDGNRIGSIFTVDGDYNGDGMPDLAVAAKEPWDVIWIVEQPYSEVEYLKGADHELDLDSPIDLGYNILAISDINGDGGDELMMFTSPDYLPKVWRTPFRTAPSGNDLCTVHGFEGDLYFGSNFWKSPDNHYFIYARGTPDRIYEFTHEQLKARIECPSDPSDVKIQP